MTVAERHKLKNNKQTMDDIRHSLERTNHEEYRSILTKQGCQFYPITNADEQHFEGITRLSECKPTTETTKSLYNLGILIEDEIKDENTGGIKQEILADRQKQYSRIRDLTLWSVLAGFVVFIIFGAIFSSADLGELSFLLAFLPAIAAATAAAFGMNRYYKSKNPTIGELKQTAEKNQRAQKQKHEQDMATTKTLLEQCGMRFFIKYFRQIKTLPLRDVVLSENYSPEEKEERLNAAKKIIESNLTDLALNTIIDVYGNSLESEEIEQAKQLLADFVSDQCSETHEPLEGITDIIEPKKKGQTAGLYDPYDE